MARDYYRKQVEHRHAAMLLGFAPVAVIAAAFPRTTAIDILWKSQAVSLLSSVCDEIRIPSCCKNRNMLGPRTPVVSTQGPGTLHICEPTHQPQEIPIRLPLQWPMYRWSYPHMWHPSISSYLCNKEILYYRRDAYHHLYQGQQAPATMEHRQ